MVNQDICTIRPIARIYTDYNEKFGIPRQSGLVDDLHGTIVFEPEFRDENALRDIEGFSHLWLIWGFSENRIDMVASPVKWSPLVSPPRLGGKTQVGVWASRSPYRPNSLGLSSVKLVEVAADVASFADAHCMMSETARAVIAEAGANCGPILIVSGADILNGTPIYDIKPYVPYSDCHADAAGGYAVDRAKFLEVDFPEELQKKIAPEKLAGLIKVLQQDPRGAYEKEPGYVYGLSFDQYDIKFCVEDACLHVFAVETGEGDKTRIK